MDASPDFRPLKDIITPLCVHTCQAPSFPAYINNLAGFVGLLGFNEPLTSIFVFIPGVIMTFFFSTVTVVVIPAGARYLILTLGSLADHTISLLFPGRLVVVVPSFFLVFFPVFTFQLISLSVSKSHNFSIHSSYGIIFSCNFFTCLMTPINFTLLI